MGIDFHNTGYGKRFFEHQLPSLIAEVGGLRAGIGELTSAVSRLAVASERSTHRRTVLVAHRDPSVLRALANAFVPEHEVHLARTHATAMELLELHEVDTIVVDAETGWPPTGTPLFDLARATNAECLCVAVVGAKQSERTAFGRRYGAEIVLDDRYPVALVQALRGYLR
jgi:hypothetical protein